MDTNIEPTSKKEKIVAWSIITLFAHALIGILIYVGTNDPKFLSSLLLVTLMVFLGIVAFLALLWALVKLF